MKDVILLFFLLFLLSCKSQNTEKHITSIVNDSEQNENDIFDNWKEHKVKNISFHLPEEMKIQSSFSNSKMIVYAKENSSLMLIINFDTLKPENVNKDIFEVIDDIDQLGKDVHLEQKQMNRDLELISTEKTKIGKINAFQIIQSSFELLEMNNMILTKSYLCISGSYLFKISIVYSTNSPSGEQKMSKVLSSFQFN